MPLALLLDALAQSAAVPTTVQLDLARLVVGLVTALFAILGAIVAYFLKNILDEFRAMRNNVQTVMAVLFGSDGKNGMRSDLRRARQLQVKHDRLLVALATNAGIDPDLDIDEREEAE